MVETYKYKENRVSIQVHTRENHPAFLYRRKQIWIKIRKKEGSF